MDNSINLFVGLNLQFFSAFDNVDVNSIMEELDSEYQEAPPSGDEIPAQEEIEETNRSLAQRKSMGKVKKNRNRT